MYLSSDEVYLPFFLFPAQAKFGRVIPKNKIYEQSGANTKLKDLFIQQVEQIVWQYKLAPETINLPAKPGVPEIQVFSIQLKQAGLHHDVLRCIDNAVKFPIIFELNFDGLTQVVASYKRPSESDDHVWILSDYFESAWLDSDLNRTAMPIALDLSGLYEHILKRLIATPAREQENMANLVKRVEQISEIQREIEKVTNRLDKEKQFNRKVEINGVLQQLKRELGALAV